MVVIAKSHDRDRSSESDLDNSYIGNGLWIVVSLMRLIVTSAGPDPYALDSNALLLRLPFQSVVVVFQTLLGFLQVITTRLGSHS